MKIALIGASGQVGSRLLKELSDRGHTITAIARNPDKIAALPKANRQVSTSPRTSQPISSATTGVTSEINMVLVTATDLTIQK